MVLVFKGFSVKKKKKIFFSVDWNMSKAIKVIIIIKNVQTHKILAKIIPIEISKDQQRLPKT